MSYKVVIKENTIEYDRYEEAFQMFKNACLSYFKENGTVLSENGMPREITEHLNSRTTEKTVSDDELLIVFRMNELFDSFANRRNDLPKGMDHEYEFEDTESSIKLSIRIDNNECALSIVCKKNEFKTNAFCSSIKSDLYFESSYGSGFKAHISVIDDSIEFDNIDNLIRYVKER